MKLKETIRKVLKEEKKKKDLSVPLKKLIDLFLEQNKDKDYICGYDFGLGKFAVKHSGEAYQRFKVTLYFDSGYGSKNWPMTMAINSKEDRIMDELQYLILDTFGILVDMYSSSRPNCKVEDVEKGEQTEGLHDTSWENDGEKITLIDLLDATDDIPVESVSVEELKPHLLTWDGDEEEVKKIDKADLQYPILILVDDDGEFISIIDGHHRAQKASRKGLKTIKAKIIPINDLPKKIRKVFGHMGKQEFDEYARTLKNARRQGRGLRFSKVAIENNPQRFRPYSRERVNESDPKVGTGKKPKGSERRLYTDENPSDTVSVKFRTKEDIIDTLNKDSFKSKPHKRQSQIINLIHQRVRAAYQNSKDPETKNRLKRAFDYITQVKEKSKEKTIRLQKQEQTEGELTEKCWKGYTQKGMKTMFGKRYPNCVKKTK